MFRLDRLRYGVAYYDEYMPCDRLTQDIELMLAAGINTVRIAESTWSTLEPQSGVFDFSSIDRVLDAMQAAGIDVIIGTPTYAVPTWLVRLHPEVLAITPAGLASMGAPEHGYHLSGLSVPCRARDPGLARPCLRPPRRDRLSGR